MTANFSSTSITPSCVASASGTSTQPTVMSARARDVLVDHARVVHLVDVVAGEHQHDARIVAAQDVEVLVHRVRGALVPVGRDALLRGQQLDEFVEAAVEERPAALHVVDQAVRFVLRRDADAADARVHAVRQARNR